MLALPRGFAFRRRARRYVVVHGEQTFLVMGAPQRAFWTCREEYIYAVYIPAQETTLTMARHTTTDILYLHVTHTHGQNNSHLKIYFIFTI